MSDAPRVLVPGGYGVFGRHLANELLATTDAQVILAGRDHRRAEAARDQLADPDRVETLALDLTDAAALEDAAQGCFAVACTAGPFQSLAAELPAAAVRAGAHWLDVSDDPGWVLPIIDDRYLHLAAEDRGVVVLPGLSTVPGISGVLARWCHEQAPAADRGRVTLFIGNRNSKGTGAMASALIGGFGDPAWVELPFGRRRAYRFVTPDAVLFERDLGITTEFRVALEWAPLGWMAAMIGRATRRYGVSGQTQLADLLSAVSTPLSLIGSDVGCVQVDVRDADGSGVSLAAVAGQRIVILPCAMALRAILDGSLAARGVLHPSTWQSLKAYLSGLRARGVRLVTRPGR